MTNNGHHENDRFANFVGWCIEDDGEPEQIVIDKTLFDELMQDRIALGATLADYLETLKQFNGLLKTKLKE